MLLVLSFSFTRTADLQFCFSIFSKVRAIGMASPELLQLVENCPTGAETLIARILNIITDKGTVLFSLVRYFTVADITVNLPLRDVRMQRDFPFLFPAVPTAELVKRVKELYHKRVSDVRFLIPVLTGLKKQEIIAVLPKLIKQSPSVVKEVFNRLLGCFHSKCNAFYSSGRCFRRLLESLVIIEQAGLQRKLGRCSKSPRQRVRNFVPRGPFCHAL